MSGPVLVVGDIVTDVLAVHSAALAVDSDIPARITVAPGGSAGNTAAWLAHLGVDVHLLGVAGADPAGDARVAELTAAGVDCDTVARTDVASTATVVVLTDGVTRTMISDRGASRLLRPSHVDAALARLPALAHVHLSAYVLFDDDCAPAGVAALRAAAARGVTTSVDAGSAAPLQALGAARFLSLVAGIDLLLANLDEARVLAPHAGTVEELALALAAVVPEVVVKLGPAGAVWAQGSTVRTVPAPRVAVVDTTGAGDAFAAGLLAARLAPPTAPLEVDAAPSAPLEVDAALAQAVRLGSLAVSRLGGRPPAPTPTPLTGEIPAV